MKTLADLKRALGAVGTKFECEHYLRREISGPRTVAIVQRNAVAVTYDKPGVGPSVSWCYWGPAANWRIEGNRATYREHTYTDVFSYIIPAQEG